MARIRTIKPEFWTDEKLSPLPPITRLVFLGLISQADDAGRLVDSARLLDGLLFPFTEDSCGESLKRLEAIGVIRRGATTSGQAVIQICNWKHQKIDKPNLSSALPEIVDVANVRPANGLPQFDDTSTTDRRNVDDMSTPHISISTSDQLPTTSDPRGAGEAGGPPVSDREAQITSVIIACNRGMGENPNLTGYSPIIPTGRSRQPVSEWLAEGIEYETIQRVVFEGAKAYRPSETHRQIASLAYFSGAVREEHVRRAAKSYQGPPTERAAAPVRDDLERWKLEHPEVYAEELASFERTSWWAGQTAEQRNTDLRVAIRERLARPRIVA